MNDSENLKFIQNLSDQLKPVEVNWSAEQRGLLWLTIHALWITLLMYFIQPFRSSFFEDLVYPRFVLEVVVFFSSLIFAGYFSLLSVVPGAINPHKLKLVFIPILILILLLIYDIVSPFKPYTHLGARSYCDVEILVYSLIPLGHLFYLAKKGFFIDKKWTLLCATLASSLIPAFLMHFACMYEPRHILIAHLGPVAVVTLIGTALLYQFSKKN